MHERKLPASPGTYVLVIQADRPGQVQIGRLGDLPLTTAPLLYIGSARGPGGLRARVGRHLRRTLGEAPPHWHIDHLLGVSRILEVWLAASPRHLECAWAAALAIDRDCDAPLSGFGASDCRCPSHLLRVTAWERLPHLHRRLPRRVGHDQLRIRRLT